MKSRVGDRLWPFRLAQAKYFAFCDYLFFFKLPNQKIWRPRKQAQTNGLSTDSPYFLYSLLCVVLFPLVARTLD